MIANQLVGGGTATTPYPVWPGQKSFGNVPPTVPPYWSVYVIPLGAASTADFQVRLLGMDLVKP